MSEAEETIARLELDRKEMLRALGALARSRIMDGFGDRADTIDTHFRSGLRNIINDFS